MQTTRVVIQTRAWVQVYPTEWSRELDPEDGFNLVLRAWSRGPPEGLEQFLKFCLHFDMGPSRALRSVLIGASCPWPGLSFYSIVGLAVSRQ